MATKSAGHRLSSDAFLGKCAKELQKLQRTLSRKLSSDLKNLLVSGDHSDITLSSADGHQVKAHSVIIKSRVPNFLQSQKQISEDPTIYTVQLDHLHLQRFARRIYTEDDILKTKLFVKMDQEDSNVNSQDSSEPLPVAVEDRDSQLMDQAAEASTSAEPHPIPPLVRRNTFDMQVPEAGAGPSDVDSASLSRLDSHTLATHIGDSGLGLDSQLSTSSTFGQQSLGSELILDSCRSLPEDDSLEFPLDVIAAPESTGANAIPITPDSLADEPHNPRLQKPSAIVNPYNVQEDARTAKDITERPIVAGFIPDLEPDPPEVRAQEQPEAQREPFFVFFELDRDPPVTATVPETKPRGCRTRTVSAHEDGGATQNGTSFEAQLSRSWDVSVGSGEITRPPVYMYIEAAPSEEATEEKSEDEAGKTADGTPATLECSGQAKDPIETEANANGPLVVEPENPLDACLPCSKLGRDLLQMFLGVVDTDMTIRVEGRDIKAHKCILSSRCVYFAAMLSGGWLESAGNLVELQGFSHRAVHFALCHIYSGASKIPDDLDMAEIASLADMFGLEGLKEVVAFTFKMNYCHFFHKPCPSCVIGVVECLPLAAAYGLEELKDRCLKWITSYLLKTWPTKTFASLPEELLDMCYASAKADINPETVLETILHCRKISVTLPQVKWSTPVARLTARLGDACCRYLSSNMSAVLKSPKFRDLTQGRGWNLASVEAVFLATVDNLPLDEACRTYAHLNSMVCDTAEGEDGFSAMVSKIHRHVERYLIHNANRVVRCNGWSLLSGELQKRIKDAAVIVFEFEKPIAPPPRLSSLNRKFTRTRSQSATVTNRPVASASTLPSTGSSSKKEVPCHPEDDPKACTLPRTGRTKPNTEVPKVSRPRNDNLPVSNPYAASARVSWESSVRLRPQSQTPAAVRPKSWPRCPRPESKGGSKRMDEATVSMPSPAKVKSTSALNRPKSSAECRDVAKNGMEKGTSRHSHPSVGAQDIRAKQKLKPSNPVPIPNSRAVPRGASGYCKPGKAVTQPNGKSGKYSREPVK